MHMWMHGGFHRPSLNVISLSRKGSRKRVLLFYKRRMHPLIAQGDVLLLYISSLAYLPKHRFLLVRRRSIILLHWKNSSISCKYMFLRYKSILVLFQHTTYFVYKYNSTSSPGERNVSRSCTRTYIFRLQGWYCLV